MSPLSLRSRPGAGFFHSAAPDFLHRRSPYEATCRLIASRLRRSMGLVKWPAKPASRLRRMSSSLPNPLGAIPVTARRARRLRINSRPLPSGRPRSLMSRSRSSAPAALKAAARLPAVRAVWPRRRKRRALTAEVARSSRIEGTKRPDRVPKSRVELTPDFQSSQGQTRNSSRSSRTWSASPITMPSVAPWFSPQAARARGRKGGRPRNLDDKKKRHAVALHSAPDEFRPGHLPDAGGLEGDTLSVSDRAATPMIARGLETPWCQGPNGPDPMITAQEALWPIASLRASCQGWPGMRFHLSRNGSIPPFFSHLASSSTPGLSTLLWDGSGPLPQVGASQAEYPAFPQDAREGRDEVSTAACNPAGLGEFTARGDHSRSLWKVSVTDGAGGPNTGAQSNIVLSV